MKTIETVWLAAYAAALQGMSVYVAERSADQKELSEFCEKAANLAVETFMRNFPGSG